MRPGRISGCRRPWDHDSLIRTARRAPDFVCLDGANSFFVFKERNPLSFLNKSLMDPAVKTKKLNVKTRKSAAGGGRRSPIPIGNHRSVMKSRPGQIWSWISPNREFSFLSLKTKSVSHNAFPFFSQHHIGIFGKHLRDTLLVKIIQLSI